MSRNNILEVIRRTLKLLSKGEEYSVNAISKKLKVKWETTLKALEFLKEIKIIQERKGKKTYRKERLFRLKDEYR